MTDWAGTDRRRDNRRKGDRRKKAVGYTGEKTFEAYMARLFVYVMKIARTRVVHWKADRADGTSEKISRKVPNAVLAKEIRKSRAGSTLYARLADLKYWGLLEQPYEWWHQGIYRTTDVARDFLGGQRNIPKKVQVRGGKVVSVSTEDISLETAMGGQYNEIAEWIAEWRQEGPS